MKRAWPLLALAALAAGGCGQKGPLYLPDKGGRVVTSAPAATQAQPAPPATAPPAATPEAAPPESAAPAAPAPPKPADKDKTQDQDSQPPK
jgi:predicted small lipoprotein YifL